MKVFLSWSKPRSEKVAELLKNWIPCIIQSVEPWFSKQNIEDGELWFNSIQNQVSDIINGIVCLTKENLKEPWILFEAGGLAKGLEKSRIYILLIDLSTDEVLLSPLSAFNQTFPTETGMKKLLHVINSRTTKPIASEVLDKVFDKFWPDFENKFREIINETKVDPIVNSETDNLTKIEDETSALLREILKRIRSIEDSNRDSDRTKYLTSMELYNAVKKICLTLGYDNREQAIGGLNIIGKALREVFPDGDLSKERAQEIIMRLYPV